MESDQYEVFALRYAHLATRTRRESFLGVDEHDAAICPVDYYVWVVRNASRTFVVDTGFNHEDAARRGRVLERLPREALATIGVDAATVEDVIITHLHFDHAGTLDHFPNARFHLQTVEMAYATGPCMCYPILRLPYDVNHVCDMVRRVYSGRVRFHDGDAEIAPGISVHLIGGHAKGVQAVRVKTARGWVVLASDSAHYFENIVHYRPFIIVHNVEDMLRGYDRLRALATSIDHIAPGHDPAVLARYPNVPGLESIACRLDLAPSVTE